MSSVAAADDNSQVVCENCNDNISLVVEVNTDSKINAKTPHNYDVICDDSNNNYQNTLKGKRVNISLVEPNNVIHPLNLTSGMQRLIDLIIEYNLTSCIFKINDSDSEIILLANVKLYKDESEPNLYHIDLILPSIYYLGYYGVKFYYEYYERYNLDKITNTVLANLVEFQDEYAMYGLRARLLFNGILREYENKPLYFDVIRENLIVERVLHHLNKVLKKSLTIAYGLRAYVLVNTIFIDWSKYDNKCELISDRVSRITFFVGQWWKWGQDRLKERAEGKKITLSPGDFYISDIWKKPYEPSTMNPRVPWLNNDPHDSILIDLWDEHARPWLNRPREPRTKNPYVPWL